MIWMVGMPQWDQAGDWIHNRMCVVWINIIVYIAPRVYSNVEERAQLQRPCWWEVGACVKPLWKFWNWSQVGLDVACFRLFDSKWAVEMSIDYWAGVQHCLCRMIIAWGSGASLLREDFWMVELLTFGSWAEQVMVGWAIGVISAVVLGLDTVLVGRIGEGANEVGESIESLWSSNGGMLICGIEGTLVIWVPIWNPMDEDWDAWDDDLLVVCCKQWEMMKMLRSYICHEWKDFQHDQEEVTLHVEHHLKYEYLQEWSWGYLQWEGSIKWMICRQPVTDLFMYDDWLCNMMQTKVFYRETKYFRGVSQRASLAG